MQRLEKKELICYSLCVVLCPLSKMWQGDLPKKERFVLCKVLRKRANAKRNALKYCRKRKSGLLTKHIRFLKAVMKKRTAGKNILILHDLVFVNRCAGESAKSNTPI